MMQKYSLLNPNCGTTRKKKLYSLNFIQKVQLIKLVTLVESLCHTSGKLLPHRWKAFVTLVTSLNNTQKNVLIQSIKIIHAKKVCISQES